MFVGKYLLENALHIFTPDMLKMKVLIIIQSLLLAIEFKSPLN